MTRAAHIAFAALLLCASAARAQDAEARATFLYNEAIRARDSGDPVACVDRLQRAREALGRDSVRIQGPLVECLHKSGRHREVLSAAALYFKLNADSQSQEFHDVGRLLLLSEEAVAREDEAARVAREAEAQRQREAAREQQLLEQARQEDQRRRDAAAAREAKKRAAEAAAHAEHEERQRAYYAKRAIELEGEISQQYVLATLWFALGGLSALGAIGGIGVYANADGDPALLTLAGAMVAGGGFGAYWLLSQSGPDALSKAESLENDRLSYKARGESAR